MSLEQLSGDESPVFMERELSRRQSDGLDVSLWWAGGIATYVMLEDAKASPRVRHRIDVPTGKSPTEVFMHPYAFLGTEIPDGVPFQDYCVDPDGTPRRNYGRKDEVEGGGD